MTPEGKLVERALAGRGEAFSELVLRWTHRVLALCHALVRHRQSAEDLTQETFVRAYVALRTLREPEKFAPWIRGIARRVCLDWIKSQRRPVVLFSQLGPDWSADGEIGNTDDGAALVEDQEENSRLLEEIDKLPEDLRTVLMLYYYGSRTYAEVAEMLEVSTATVNARLANARKILRKRLKSLER